MIPVLIALGLLAACSSDTSNSPDNSGASAPESSASYGIVPIDTTTNVVGSAQDDLNISITSSSKTEYRFNSEKHLFPKIFAVIVP